MSAPVDRDRPEGEGLEGLEDDLGVVSHWYHSASSGEPRAEVDDALLAAARRAVSAGPRVAQPATSPAAPFATPQHAVRAPWKVPFALAATIVVSVSIGYLGIEERPDVFEAHRTVQDSTAVPPVSIASAVTSASPSAASPNVAQTAPIVTAPSPPQLARTAKESRPVQAPNQALATDKRAIQAKSVATPAGGPAEAAGERATKAETVTVTGSSIRRSDAETPSPVQVLSDENSPAPASAPTAATAAAPAPGQSSNFANSSISSLVKSRAESSTTAPRSSTVAPIVPAPAAPAASVAPAEAAPAKPSPSVGQARTPDAPIPTQGELVEQLKRALDDRNVVTAREKLADLWARYPDFVLPPDLVAKLQDLGLGH